MNVIKSFYDQHMPSPQVPRLTPSNFDRDGNLLGLEFTKKTVIVMFYTPECRGCQELAPELTKYNSQYASANNSIAVAIDISAHKEVKTSSSNYRYSLNLLPTVIFFQNGIACSAYTGVRTASALNNFVRDMTACSIK